MARSNSKSPRLRLTKSLSRVRVRSPSFQFMQSSDPLEMEQKMEFLGEEEQQQQQESFNGGPQGAGNNKVIVVVDSSVEAKAALDWALSHTIQARDTLILLRVAQPSKRESNGKVNPRSYEWIESMKTMCEKKMPGVVVEVAIIEGKNRGEAIVEGAKEKMASLLVLGQRKKSMLRKFMRRLRMRGSQGVVDYCIQNASCMTIAVRRKSNKLGGYLITTKRHKKFWLLA